MLDCRHCVSERRSNRQEVIVEMSELVCRGNPSKRPVQAVDVRFLRKAMEARKENRTMAEFERRRPIRTVMTSQAITVRSCQVLTHTVRCRQAPCWPDSLTARRGEPYRITGFLKCPVALLTNAHLWILPELIVRLLPEAYPTILMVHAKLYCVLVCCVGYSVVFGYLATWAAASKVTVTQVHLP